MASQTGQQSSKYTLQYDHVAPPTVLSTLQFPLQPTSSTSLNNGTDNSSRYRHVLSSKAISPQMDLVAIISRDVAAPSSSNAVDAASLLPPPPPGMSAVANQARLRMLMMARARALAVGGKGPVATTAETPRVTKCPSMRLSLWRMASATGEQGSRVWDVEITVPDHFEDLGKDVKENENMGVCAMSWSPDCRSIALTVEVTRFKRHPNNEWVSKMRKKRFLILYAMQDGKQERLIVVPNNLESESEQTQLFGIIWRQLALKSEPACIPGSAEYILRKMESLPEIARLLEDREGKGKQRQRAMNAMRGDTQKQDSVDLKSKEIMANKTDDLSISLLNHPRTTSSSITTRGEGKEQKVFRSIACVHDDHTIHLFLDSTIYLGCIPVEKRLEAVDLITQTGDLFISSTKASDATINVSQINTLLTSSSTRFSCALHIVSLSTISFHLLTYYHDALVDVRNHYRSTHISCITPWIQKGKILERKYSTHFPSEMQMLLLTSTANEAITSILVGNEAMTEGDLGKLRAEIASAWNKIEVLLDAMLQAMQRLSIVIKEVNGCWLWQERYGDFFSKADGHAIAHLLDLIGEAQGQCYALLRHAQQESKCWMHFYRWFKFERTRQEALRDQIPEPKSDVAFDVLLLVDFLKRGFYNDAFEGAIGIVLDKKTRGLIVEDEDEEVQEESVMEQSQIESKAKVKGNAEEAIGRGEDEIGAPTSGQSLEDLMAAKLIELQKPPEVSDFRKRSAPSKDDVAQMRAYPYIMTGPIAGLSKRYRGRTKSVNMLEQIQTMLKISSTLFSNAISRFATPQKPRDQQEISLASQFTPFRSDGLISMSQGHTEERDGVQTTRTLLDGESNRQYLLGIRTASKDEGSLSMARIDRGQYAIRLAEISYQGQLLDAGFYTDKEIVALIHIGQKTFLVCIRIDALITGNTTSAPEMIRAHRCYEIQQGDASQRPTQLALNHVKEVAATLDEHGRLVYYDLVHLEQGQDMDQDME